MTVSDKWIRSEQSRFYPEVLRKLNEAREKESSVYPVPSIIRQLGLFLSKDNIIRCAGRIYQNDLGDSSKYPSSSQNYLRILISPD